jgi:hypothetical protein
MLAVELRNHVDIEDVRNHIEKMEKLRRYFDLRGDRRKLYGALGADIIPDPVFDFTLKQGFYIITQPEGTVEKPKGRPRAW